MFSIRIVTTSHYQAVPLPGFDVTYSEFRDAPIKRVPVLRIFGSTTAGQKTCLHVHGVFPYLYVPYDGTQPTDRYLKQFAASLDKAINIANHSVKSELQHVFKISLVSGIPMYGYHEQEEPFLKIYLYNPNNVRKAADLLLGGAVMNKPFQPHESHLPYYLQLFMDYNLYGMNLISVGALKFRNKKQDSNRIDSKAEKAKTSGNTSPDVPSSNDSFSAPTPLHSCLPSSETPSSGHIWNGENIPSDLWHPDCVERQSICELEVDVVAADIFNRHEVASNVGTNPGLAALWEDEKQRRRETGESSQIASDESEERPGAKLSDSEKELLAKFCQMVQEQSAASDSQSGESQSVLSTETSLRASQLERHLSREDSNSSQGTVVFESDDEGDKNMQPKDDDHLAIVNVDSIHKVVAASQSFSVKSSQGSESQDRTVAEILASLLEEDAPPPSSSQVAALEEKDSILSASILLNEEDEVEEERETLAMTQAVGGNTEGDDVGFNVSGLEDTWVVDTSSQDPSGDIIMGTDDEDDEDDIDLLPQFDGASDKLNNSHMNQPSQAMSENQSRMAGHGGMVGHGQMSLYPSSAGESSWMGRGSQMYSGSSSSWAQQQHAWSQQQQQQQSSEVAWPSRSPSWSSPQQSSYSHWPAQSQQMPSSGPQYSPSQHPTRSPSSASPASNQSFHSASHHPYTSPNHSVHHHQGYSSPGSSSSQHSFAHSPPHYQSPTQEMYPPPSYQRHNYHQYPTGHSYPTSYSSQQYSQQMAGQSYKSPSVTQPYISPTTTNPPFQSPSGSISNQSPTAGQAYKSPTGAQPTSPSQPFASTNCGPSARMAGNQNCPTSSFQSPCYQSPPYTHPYYSHSHNSRNSSTPASPGFGHFQKGVSQMKDLSGQMTSKSQLAPSMSKVAADKRSIVVGGTVDDKNSASLGKMSTEMSSIKSRPKSNTNEYQSNLHAPIAGNKMTGQDQSSLCSPPSQNKMSPSKTNHGMQDMMLGTSTGPQKPLHTQSKSDISMRPADKSRCQVFHEQPDKSQSMKLEEEKDAVAGQCQSSKSISRLDFRPKDITSECNNKDAQTNKASSTASEVKNTNQDIKQQVACSTPMIQQLLMEESPAKMNIKPEDREAVMKKPMLSPTRPQKKTKSGRGKSKYISRPRSASLTVGLFPRTEGMGHQPPLPASNTPMLNKAGRSHSISLPFGNQQGLMEPMHEWQHQPLYHQTQQQQNFSPVPQWQQQQHQWGGNQWQDSASVEGVIPQSGEGGMMKENKSKGPSMNRTQQRSFSADCAPLLYTQTNSLPQNVGSQPEPLCSSSGNSDVVVSSEAGSQAESVGENSNENDSSSLSNLYQLVSDVSFEGEDNVWNNSPSTIVPGFLQDSADNETPKSTSPSVVSRGSPDKKDFITLEPPSKTSSDRAGSDTTGMTSSEESDRMDYEIAADLIPSQLKGTDFASGWIHPRLGKQNRMKRMGLVRGAAGSSQCNPSYTYTFHVPTPVFKKLKFFRSAQARKMDLKVIRMHPMDARRYSLLKIGKELVQVKRLSESDLAKYNCTLPSPSEISQMASDSSFSRVNLDIPQASSSQSSNSFGEEGSSFSQYDTDFPPNKVAPPSSFSVTQVTVSPSRSLHSFTPPVMSQSISRPAQFAAMTSSGQYGMPGTSGQGNGSQLPEGSGIHHQGQQMIQADNMYENFRSGTGYPGRYGAVGGDQTDGSIPLPQINGQTGDQNFHHPSPSPHGCRYSSGHQAAGSFSGPSASLYAQQMQYQQQQQQSRGRNDSESYWDPKNGLRSPGQHGPTGTIDKGLGSGHSGEDEEDDDLPNTIGTFPINTRVNAQRCNFHAYSMAANVKTDFVVDAENSSSRKKSSRHFYDRDDSFQKCSSTLCKKDNFSCNSVKMTGSQICVKRKKTRRKRSKRRRHLKRCQAKVNHSSSECDEKINYENPSQYHENLEEYDHLNLEKNHSAHNYEANKTVLKNNDADLIFEGQSKKSNSIPNKGVVNCRDKNWKALKLQIPKQALFLDTPVAMNYSPLSVPVSESEKTEQTPASTDTADSYQHCQPESDSHSTEKLKSPREPQLGVRQSMRQAKLRSISVTSLSAPETPVKERKKKNSLIEGVHYIVVGKFKGHQSMMVKIPKVSVSKDETVSAAYYEKLASKDIMRTVETPPSGDISLATPCSTSLTDIESKCQLALTDAVLSDSESDFKALGKGNVSLSDANAFGSDFILSGSPCTSPETRFFTELRKTFDKKCKGKEGAMRKSFGKNVFFPGIIESTFLNFQTLFQSNVSRLEGCAYSSSSDEEGDHLDNVILKGKIRMAKYRHLDLDKKISELEATQVDHKNAVGFESIQSDSQNSDNPSRTLQGSPIAPKSFISPEKHCEEETQISQGKAINSDDEKSDKVIGKMTTSLKLSEQDNGFPSSNKPGVTCRLKLFFGKGAEREGKEVGLVNLEELQDGSEELHASSRAGTPNRTKKRRKTFKRLSLLKNSRKQNARKKNETAEEPPEVVPSREASVNHKDTNESQDHVIGEETSTAELKTVIRVQGNPESSEKIEVDDFSQVAEVKESAKEFSTQGGQNAFLMDDIGERQKDIIDGKDDRTLCDGKENKEHLTNPIIRNVLIHGEGNAVDSNPNESLSSVHSLGVDSNVSSIPHNTQIRQSHICHTDESQDIKPDINHDFNLNMKLSSLNGKDTKETHDERNEFIRRQMAFYEDISSDPDTDDTILNETNVNLSVSLSAVDHAPTTNLSPDESINSHSQTVERSSSSSLQDKASEIANSPDFTSNITIKCDSLQKQTQSRSEAPNSKTEQNIQMDDEISQESCLAELGKSDRPDILPCSDESRDVGSENFVKERPPWLSETIMETVLKTESDGDCSYNNKRSKSTAQTGVKPQPKSKKKSSVKYQEYNGSSSSDEKDKNVEVSTKRLRQRKQTQYTYYLDGIDSSDDLISSSEDEHSDPSPAHVASRSSGGKNVKVKKKNVGKSTPVSSTRGKRSTALRGKKKKVKGGSKLLNSLSLLHMATLANLTESQDSPSSSQAGEAGQQYSDRAGSDHAAEYSPSLEAMSFTSPQNSEELDSSPLPFSPTDKKKSKQAHTSHSVSPSVKRRLLPGPSRQRNSLKPGCNGASNVGTRPFAINRLVNPVAVSSPVPSNFIFASNSNEATANVVDGPEEDQTPLAVAKAKITPYSMKHILRLTTDDSMDSDSKDSLAVTKAPENKKAQVKSTALSMSDILKMTSVNSADEGESMEASNSLLSQIANFEDSAIVTPPVLVKERILPEDHQPPIREDSIEGSNEVNSSVEVEDKTDDVEEPATAIQKDISQSNATPQLASKDGRIESSLSQNEEEESPQSLETSKLLDSQKDTQQHSPAYHNNKSEDVLENRGQAALTPVTRLKPLIHPSDDETCQGEQEADHAQAKGMALTPGDAMKSPVRCLSPLNCIIEETQLSRSSQDYVSSGEPDPRVSDDPFRQETVASLRKISPELVKIKEKSQWLETSDNNIKDFSGKDHQKCDGDKEKKPLPVIMETLVETDPTKNLSPQSEGKSVTDANLLDPLTGSSHYHQIVPPSHPSPSRKKLSGNSLRTSYPWCWQWPAPSASDESMSPLNLCTSSSKLQNVYSPITPTSPVSPYIYPQSIAASNLSALTSNSKLSPPIKKSKPLWYPWLSAEESRQKHSELKKCSLSLSAVAERSSVDNSSTQSKERRNPSQSSALPRNGEPTSPISPVYPSQWNDLSTLNTSSRGIKGGKRQTEKPSSTSQLKVQKEALSTCKTVSQFLGTVIDTAYEQANCLKKQTKAEVDDDSQSQSQREDIEQHLSNRYNASSTLPDQRNRSQSFGQKGMSYNNIDVFSSASQSHGIYPNFSHQEWDSHRRIHSTWQDHQSFFKTHSENNISVSTLPMRKNDSERVQAMLENERLLRNKFALSSPNIPCTTKTMTQLESMSRTDRLVTQLIKGDESNPVNDEPQDSSKRKRKGGKSAKEGGVGKGSESGPSGSSGSSAIKHGSGKTDKDHHDEEASQEGLSLSSVKGDRPVIIHPTKRAPSRLRVGESICEFGLNTVQVPMAFCSSLEDLPDKPMEQGGRVLKVASRRVCELKPFASSHFIDGILDVRSRSLASSSLLSSQAESRSMVEQLKDEPQLRFLLTPDRPVVIAPCRTPVKRDTVITWLEHRMKEISEMKENIQVPFKLGPSGKDENQVIEPTPVSHFSQCLDSSPEGMEDSTLFDTDLDLSFSHTHSSALPKKIKIDTTVTSPSTSSMRLSQKKAKERWEKGSLIKHDIRETEIKAKCVKRRLAEHAAISSHPLSDKPENEDCSPVAQRKSQLAISSKSSGDDPPPPLLKRISTDTENALRRNILMSQTQRQFSELGFTAAEISQIEGPTPKNTHNFKVPKSNMHDAKAVHKYQYVTALSVELHIETRGDLRPDPEHDAIQAVFYSVFDDIPLEKGPRNITGMIMVDRESWEIITARSGTTSQATPGKSSHHPGLSQKAYSPQPSTSTAASASPSSSKGKGKGKGKRSPSPSPKSRTPSGKKRVGTRTLLEQCGVEDVEATYVQDEMSLFQMLVEIISRFDPDILVGFEIQKLSWGYLLHRAAQLGIELCSKIARVPDAKGENRYVATDDEWGADHMSEIHVVGRVVLNLWRILRHEVSLNTYTFENAAYHILHERIPLFGFRTLTKWFSSGDYRQRWRIIEHYVRRVQGQLKIVDQLDLIGKTSEFARVFGIEFFDVLSRGTQIRVESMMLRLAKPMNYVAVSPNVNQRARQRAAECIPLTLEPESKYYTDPVVVLDFQSLYPSIMIAYNYCFSTCLGRLQFLEKANDGPIEFGCTSLSVNPKLLKKLKDKITVSPNGVVFLKSSVRKGVISAMVEEILNTRIMVKKSMKQCKDDKTLTRMLDARQLGLKLIANVTYGYTGASFSGRMPCIEVGDSIVRKARESLERAIKLVEDTPRWGARVVYGDTDSMFIQFPGRSKDEAFFLGHEIADAVTAMFPSPMKLKFEKVYLPCVLQTKKHYVGFMYETPDQKDPVYDAKGIETVRRDSCSAVSKILERSVKVLFSTHDLSRVRAYVTRQLHKLLEGKVSILDLIFAKEFRGKAGYKPGACVPALEIARKRAHVDRCAEPRAGERVPYVIVHGSPGLPLIQLVREPQELVQDTSLRLNAVYYITKQILPPLDRLFSLIGINVFKWYQDMPKVVRLGPMMSNIPTVKQGTISQFFASSNCVVCDTQCKNQICLECRKDPQLVVFTINSQMREWERTYNRLSEVCNTCQGIQDISQPCVSMDCPIVFRRHIAKNDLLRADTLKSTLQKFMQF